MRVSFQLLIKRNFERRGLVSSLDLCSAGASPNALLAWGDPKWAEAYLDDVSGGYLDPVLTKDAQR